MIGIDVGATQVTLSTNDEVATFPISAPPQLAHLIAQDLPHIELSGAGCELTSAADAFAQIVRDTLDSMHLKRSRHDGDEETASVALAVPGWWSPDAVQRVRIALNDQEVRALVVNDAEAAVAGWSEERAQLPEAVAVVSLRNHEASVVLVEDCNARARALLSPTFAHDEGGDFLDTTVLQHLIAGLRDMNQPIDVETDEVISAAREALPQCRELRETLSLSAAESIHLELPGNAKTVRVVRGELEELAAPWLDAVLANLGDAISQSPRPIKSVLLVGGLASMPLVSQRVSAELGLDVSVPSQPREVVARGARILLDQHIQASATWRDTWKNWASRFQRRRSSKTAPVNLRSRLRSTGEGLQFFLGFEAGLREKLLVNHRGGNNK